MQEGLDRAGRNKAWARGDCRRVVTPLAAQRPTIEDPISDLVKADHVIDAVAIIRMREGLSLTEARASVAELQRTLK